MGKRIAEKGDAIVSDELNHASIIDAGRLSRAVRKVYAHSDVGALDQALAEVSDSPVRKIFQSLTTGEEMPGPGTSTVQRTPLPSSPQ